MTVLWKKGRFHPGFTWRVHTRNLDSGEKLDLAAEDTNHLQFDELVIDHWFHLEQMDDRDWWIGLGNWNINVHIDGNGLPRISSYENESEGEYAKYVERVRTDDFWHPGDPIKEELPKTMPNTSK